MAGTIVKKSKKFFDKKKSDSKTKDAKKLLRDRKKSTDDRPEWARGLSDAEYKDILGSPRRGKSGEENPDMVIHRKKGGKVDKPRGCGQAQRGYGKAMMGGGKIKTKSSY
jgi:hypothetical protein